MQQQLFSMHCTTYLRMHIITQSVLTILSTVKWTVSLANWTVIFEDNFKFTVIKNKSDEKYTF